MVTLKDTPDENKARTRPVKLFNMAVTELEDRMVEDLLDEDVDNLCGEGKGYKVLV